MSYQVSIPTTTVSSDAKPYTIYNVNIQQPLRTSTLPKRYSDFTTLHASLMAATGAAPPAPLPAKSWFKRTVNNPELTESRRQGLQTYLKAIETNEDSKWRNSTTYRSFLGLSGTAEGKNSAHKDIDADVATTMSAGAWLDLHTQLKNILSDARLALNKRESAVSTTVQHELGAGAKKYLVRANTIILRLDQGLRGLQEGRGGDKLGEGEIRRRKDLISRARKEREGLEGVLNAWSAKNPGKAGAGGVGSAMATEGQKEGLFAGAPSATGNSSQTSLASGAGVGRSGGPATSGRRVLGGPVKETERTRELDNEGVLQLQRQIMQEQDQDVGDLASQIRKMKEMGIAINEELEEQVVLLNMLDQDVDRVDGKINIAKKRVDKIR